MLAELERMNPVSRGLLLPDGDGHLHREREPPARVHAVLDGGRRREHV